MPIAVDSWNIDRRRSRFHEVLIRLVSAARCRQRRPYAVAGSPGIAKHQAAFAEIALRFLDWRFGEFST